MQEKKCPNCGRLYPMDASICPGCKHPNIVGEEYVEKKEDNNKHNYRSPRSIWYSYATVIIVIGLIGLIASAIISIMENNYLFLIGGVGEFVLVTILCAIVQLLAGIKQGIDDLRNK